MTARERARESPLGRALRSALESACSVLATAPFRRRHSPALAAADISPLSALKSEEILNSEVGIDRAEMAGMEARVEAGRGRALTKPLRRAVAARVSLVILSLVVSVNVAAIARSRPGEASAFARYTPRGLMSAAIETATTERTMWEEMRATRLARREARREAATWPQANAAGLGSGDGPLVNVTVRREGEGAGYGQGRGRGRGSGRGARVEGRG